MGKKLVAYFSASGTTRKIAEMIAQAAEADLYEITPKQPYSKADLNCEQRNWNILKTKALIQSILMPAILFEIELHRQNLQTTANKLQCEVIPFLLLNTQPPPAAVAVSKNGTNSPNTEN